MCSLQVSHLSLEECFCKITKTKSQRITELPFPSNIEIDDEINANMKPSNVFLFLVYWLAVVIRYKQVMQHRERERENNASRNFEEDTEAKTEDAKKMIMMVKQTKKHKNHNTTNNHNIDNNETNGELMLHKIPLHSDTHFHE